jgi:hypothetical protein
VNILDENITINQIQLLESWRIRVRQIGHEVGHQGMQDSEIITLLHSLRRNTFFTRDRDFFYPHLCHSSYCLVNLGIDKNEAAQYIRRVLRHPMLNTEAKRVGKVIRVTPEALYVWRLNIRHRETLSWPMP